MKNLLKDISRVIRAQKKHGVLVATELKMLLPSLTVLAAISIYPFITMVVMSFYNSPKLPGQIPDFIGLDNWVRMLLDGGVWHSWLVTLVYFILALSLQLTLGIGISLALDQFKKLRGLLTTLIIAPMFMAPVSVGLLWHFLFHDSYGIYTYFLHQLGFFNDISILGNIHTALPAIILMETWEWTPLIAIIIIAGLQSLPEETYEAAVIDGANYWQQLIYITLPMLRQTITVALLIRTMDILRFYDTIMVNTGGGPANSTKILAIRIFEYGFRLFNFGYAAVLGLTLLLVSVILANIFVKVLIEEGEME
ncbi:carbohydrate ABC transporter permease [Hydrogenispora ethanolica]|uniref:carbohydrate ABC transporter permease n=1 Tax=Hydrogenispora ethanolica TaxID=1082276 RepID=UPI001FB478A1|nr:sugar ABC transporter permease [Hydrogenispora ethanolica]